jgi:hypothetical protein
MAIPDDLGFDALVAAKIAEPGTPVGVWELGSNAGAVAGVNKAAQDENKFGTPNPGSLDAAQLVEITASPQYAALLTCASR